MRLCVFLSLLLSVTAIVSTVPVAKSSDPQNDREDQHNQVSLQTTIPSRFVDTRSTSQQFDSNGRSLSYYQKRDSDPYGKGDHEKLIALCEAGFVTGCRQAIEGARTAASSAGKAQKSQPETFLESALALLTRYSYDEEEKDVITWGLFYFSFIVISVVVVCIAIAAFGRDRWKCTAIVHNEKRSLDA